MQAVVGALRAVLGLDSVAFEKGANEAQKRLGLLEKQFTAFGKNASGSVSQLNNALSAVGAGLSVGAIVAFGRSVMTTVGGLGELAEQLGISTDALQAYQAIAAQSGVDNQQLEAGMMKLAKRVGEAAAGNKEAIESFKKLNVELLDSNRKVRPLEALIPEITGGILKLDSAAEKSAKSQEFLGRSGARWLTIMGEMSGGTTLLIEKMRALGLVISEDQIKKLDEWDDKLKVLQIQWRLMFAEFMVTNVPPAIEEIQKLWEATKREIEAIVRAWKWIKENVVTGQAVDSSGLPTEDKHAADQRRLAALMDESAEWQKLAAALNITDEQRIRNTEMVRDIEREIAVLRATMPTVITVTPQRGGEGAGTVEPAWGLGTTPKGVSSPTVVRSGGGGQSPEERARQNMAAWKQEMKDYGAALQTLAKDSQAPLEDVEKALESQRRLTERIRQGIKGLPEGSPVAQQIRDQATATEEARKAFDDYLRAAKDADTTDKQFGDGKTELARKQRELNEAFATGRLSLDAFTIATAEYTRNAELQRLKMIGLTNEGLGGFIAGFKTAQMEWDRANSAFAAGQKAFESAMGHMETALAQFVATGKISFRSLANSIIADLLRMQLKAASSGIFGAIGNLLGPLLGLGGGGPSPGLRAGGLAGGAFAAGGMPPIGQPSWVGERGPELFVPRAAGTIIPNDALSGGGGGVVFNISVTGGDEAGVYRALNRVMPQMKTQLADYILDRRMRGGKFQQGFRG